jgi:hypothetical protein
MKKKKVPKLSKSQKLAREFVAYVDENPDQRFWQAIRNFTGSPYVFIGDGIKPPTDSFYVDKLEKTK